MKLLFILPEYYPHSGGGISTYYLHYIKALKSEVDEICVMVGSGYTQADDIFNVDGIKVEYLKPAIYKSYLPKFNKFDLTPEYRNNMAAAWAMWEQCKQGEDYDIVECTDFGLGFVPWLVNHRKPVLVRLHGSAGQIDLFETKINGGLSADLHRQTELILLSYADELISHSEANKIYWENIFQTKKVALIYPTFQNDTNIVPLKKREDYGIVCGRVQDWKGPDILCQALEQMDCTAPNIKWYGKDTTFDGEMNKTTQLKRDFATTWGKFITHEQPLPNAAITTIQQNAKFALIPSTWDMFNFTGLEYLSAGTPLICSNSAGVAELIENGINGFKYANNNPKELANCIDKLLKLTEAKYHQLIENGKNTVLKKLGPKEITKANLKIYKSLTNFKISYKENVFIDEMYKPSHLNNSLNSLLRSIQLKALLKYISARLISKLLSITKR